jgi:Transposase DDE domain
VRVQRECYQLEAQLERHLSALRPAQRRGLAWWVVGTILAGSACQAAVVAALEPLGVSAQAMRQYLREWLYDGTDRAAPCTTSVAVRPCFAPLLRWVLSWWQGTDLPLALDATNLGPKLAVLMVSIPYRGSALPIAWRVVPATEEGAWMADFLALLEAIQPAVPTGWMVLVLADRGLWSPRLWDAVQPWGWHPLLRLTGRITFRPSGQRQRVRATRVVPGPGHAWIGTGVACKDRPDRRAGTLLVVWAAGQEAPWVLLTDLPPDAVDPGWYGLRAWIELGFRALKGMGFHWERTRRTDPTRVERHLLVLAVAMLVTVAVGTRAEDAERAEVDPARLHTHRPPVRVRPRWLSVFTRGLDWGRTLLLRQRRIWTRLWLAPDAWPTLPPGLHIHRILTPQEVVHA